MKFRPYIPQGSTYPVKYYSVEDNAITIGHRKQIGLHVTTPDDHTQQIVTNFLSIKGVELKDFTLATIYPVMQSKGLIVGKGAKSTRNQSIAFPKYVENSTAFTQNGPKTVEQLIVESKSLELEKTPFKASTIKNVLLVISSNEPKELLSLLQRTKLANVSSGHLKVGDIMATDNKTGDTLLIERKTVQDLYQSVINDLHSHDQCERLFSYVQAARSEGKRARAIWIVEAQENGKHLIDNSLPEMKQVSGLLNYFDMIADQSIFQSYSMEHTSYLVAKFCQGFFEQKLFYPAKTSNPSVNRTTQDRLLAKTPVLPVNGQETGVVRHTARDLVNMLSYIPSINTNVARKLAATGKKFSEIACMSLNEIKSIDGVGDKTAIKIFEDFNKKGGEDG